MNTQHSDLTRPAPSEELPSQRNRRTIAWALVSGAGVVTLLIALYILVAPRIGSIDGTASLDGAGGGAHIPVRLMKTVTMNGVTVTVMKSTINKGASYLYTLEGSITARDDVRSMRMRIELVDGAGRVVSTDTFNPLDEQKEPITPGNWISFKEEEQGTPSVKEVRLGIEAIDKGGVLSGILP
jgi:hypothetical protein